MVTWRALDDTAAVCCCVASSEVSDNEVQLDGIQRDMLLVFSVYGDVAGTYYSVTSSDRRL